AAAIEIATMSPVYWRMRPSMRKRLTLRDALAVHHHRCGEQHAMTGPLAVDVVDELEITLPQFEHRDVGGRSRTKRAEVPERRHRCRRMVRDARDGPVDGHPEHEELRDHRRKIQDAERATGTREVGRNRVRPEPVARCRLDHLPGDMRRAAVADVET